MEHWSEAGISVWERLQQTRKPIVLYGMGLGAEKILGIFAQKNIRVSDVFASDGFVRGHSFAGFQVLSFSQIQEKYPDCFVAISFASQRPEVLELMDKVAAQYETVAPDVQVAGSSDQLFDMDFLRLHWNEFLQVKSMLADEKSCQVFDNVIQYKITGDFHLLRQCETDRDEVFSRIIRPGANRGEIFLDLGAYNGDTVQEFLDYAGDSCQKIYAWEPDPKNFRKLAALGERLFPDNSAQKIAEKRFLPLNQGVWSEPGELFFASRSGRNSALSSPEREKKTPGERGQMVPVDSVDHSLAGAPVTCMKLDVEGAEYAALLGAKQTIMHFRPTIMVSAYHRNEDLFAIPLLMQQLAPGYRVYLRHHPYVPAWETNFYFLP